MFNSLGRRIAEYDEASGALIREYVWMGWDPVAVVEGGVVHYVRADHIGRPAFATDVSGAVIWSASYLPFGEVRVSTGTVPTMRFPGQWFQSESGLHQNWMRDYDPTTGRYLQPDPLGLVDGASVYGYAVQNPGRWTDPRGENPLAVCLHPLGAILCRETARAAVKGCVAAAQVTVAGAQIVFGAFSAWVATPSEACGCEDDVCSPSTSPIWNSYLPHKGRTKTNGLSGSNRKYYEWDYTHCEIEMYDRLGKHIGVLDARTGIKIKPARPGRRISV